ncbi:MAG: hypothetical protein HY331_07965 [Chloroflexi bacterium]|nr:hypothetical protein [Chloroflexota bacterium]
MTTASLDLGTVLPALFQQLEDVDIRYCLLRGGEESLATAPDVDLLVGQADLAAFKGAAERLGFVELPAWGHWPHRFFVTYAEAEDRWIKLDIVTEVAFGRPAKTLRIELADHCLAYRRRGLLAYLPAAEDDLFLLLLHCLIDKAAFAPHHRARLLDLRDEIGDGETCRSRILEVHLALAFPGDLTWSRLSAMLAGEQWDDLLTLRPAVIARLARSQQVGRLFRSLSGKLLRKLDRFGRRRGVSVALLAPDGAGKTTLAATLAERCPLPVSRIYMGSNAASSTVGFPPSRWLRTARRRLVRLPRPLVSPLSISADLLESWFRYAVASYRCRRGELVVFDRYGYDALIAPQTGSWRRRIRRRLVANACPAPDLVVYLDVPADELYRRKQEHAVEWLEQQRQGYLRLQTALPGLTVLDARHEPAVVRRQLTSLIWRQFSSEGSN